MLTLHTYFRSSASYRVHIALELKSLAYTAVPVHLVRGGGEQHSAAFAALNPAELVPVLVYRGATLTQSLAIIEYQVERVAERATLNSRHVKIPGAMVDCVVVAEAEHHQQTFATTYNAAYSGELRVPAVRGDGFGMGLRKVMARRAALELRANSVVNLGICMPEGVASVAAACSS